MRSPHRDEQAAPGAEPVHPEDDLLADVLATDILAWYGVAARDLPWRRPGTSAWAVLVSEIMLQQTPVGRVLPVYAGWLERWPTPAALAAAAPGDAVRMWGKLGYPRRALRLHAAARVLVDRFGGAVPDAIDALLSLPGVGEYTARAVASFAFAQRHAVVDTNVRRVVARAVLGRAEAGPPSTRRDLVAVEALMPADPATAARFAVALMELGAMICTARAPDCAECPLAPRCAWLLAGRPAYDGPVVRTQRFSGTDRQVRGLLMDVVRANPDPVQGSALDLVWADSVQRQRALGALIEDGLIVPLADGRFALPA